MSTINFISEENALKTGTISGNYIDVDALLNSYTDLGEWEVRSFGDYKKDFLFTPNRNLPLEERIRISKSILASWFGNGITPSQIETNQYIPYYRVPLKQIDDSIVWYCISFSYTDDGFYCYQGTTTVNDQNHKYNMSGDGWDTDFHEYEQWWTEEGEIPIYMPVENMSLCFMRYQGKSYLHFNVVGVDIQNGYIKFGAMAYDGIGIPDVEYSEEYGEYSDEGGYNVGGLPSFDDSSVSIGIPSDPNISVSNLGFLNTYKVTSAGLEGMLNELFPDEPLPIIPQPSEGGFLSDVAYSINALSSTVGNLFTSFINSNLMQYVVDVHAIPVSPDTVGSANVKIGFKELQTTAQKVVHDYVTVDCGSLSLDEFRKNFTDYALCKYQLYLPFVGVVPIQPSLFLGTGGKINVTYKFNIIDGSFTAFISCTSSKSKLKNSVVGQYSGNCCVHIPITTNSYSNIVSGLVSGVSHSISAVEGSKLNVSGGADELMSAVGTTMTQPAYNLSNGYNATSSFMGVRTPYFIISRPVQSFSAEYPHEKGLPLNVTYKLSQLVGSGFTVCDSPHIDIECSEYERAEIERALTTGIVL